MADKISLEIGLDGGEEVTRQLADMGKTGQKAFGDIQDAADQLNLNSASTQFDGLGNTGQAAFQKIQSAAQNAVVFENIIQGVKKVEGAFESLGTAVTRMATRMTRSLGVFGVLARSFGPVGIAAGVAAGAILKFGNDSAKALSELNVEAAKLDLTAQKFDGMRQALSGLGISSDTIVPGLQKLKEALDQDFFSQNITTGLQQFIGELERMPDGVGRTQIAIQRLGDELGGQVIAGLQAGTLSAENFRNALGRVTPATQQQIADAARYEAALNQLGNAWTQLKVAFAPIVTPVFQFLTQELQNLKKDIKEIIAEFMLLKAVFDVFKAGVQGQDMDAAAKRAVEAYKQMTQAAGQAGQQAGQASEQTAASMGRITGAAANATGAINQTGEAARQTGQTGAQAGQQIADGLSAVQNPLTGFYELVNNTTQALGQAGQAGGQATQQIADGLRAVQNPLTGFYELVNNARVAVTGTGQASTQATQQIADGLRAVQNPLTGFYELVNKTGQAGTQAGTEMNKANTGAANSAEQATNKVGQLEQAYEKLGTTAQRAKQFLAFPQDPMTGQRDIAAFDPANFFAGGGLLGGRGTGTSDSNLAWVSRGEYITPARAVAQPGVLSFLEALRHSGGNLSRVLNGMGRFALGGMVPRMIPAFATGGLAGGSNVTIQFPGLPPISGLRASSDVVDQLHRAAALAQVRSGGRKPSRYS